MQTIAELKKFLTNSGCKEKLDKLRKDELVDTLIKLKKKDFTNSSEANALARDLSGKSSMVSNSKKRKYEDREEVGEIDRLK